MIEEAYVGEKDDWVHDVTIAAPASGQPDFQHTPDAGVVVIGFLKNDVTSYWNGSAFVVGPPIELPTTITGKISSYPFRHIAACRGGTVFMYGWTSRNGMRAPVTETVYRRVNTRNIGTMVQ